MKNNLSEKYNKNKKTSILALVLCFFAVIFTGGGLSNITSLHSLGAKLFFISFFIASILIFIWLLSWIILYKTASKYQITKKELPKWLIKLTKIFGFWDIAFYKEEKKKNDISKGYKIILPLLIIFIIVSFSSFFYLVFKNTNKQNLAIILTITIGSVFLILLFIIYKIAINYIYKINTVPKWLRFISGLFFVWDIVFYKIKKHQKKNYIYNQLTINFLVAILLVILVISNIYFTTNTTFNYILTAIYGLFIIFNTLIIVLLIFLGFYKGKDNKFLKFISQILLSHSLYKKIIKLNTIN